MIHKSTVRLGFSPRIPLFHNNFHSSSTTVCWSHTPIRGRPLAPNLVVPATPASGWRGSAWSSLGPVPSNVPRRGEPALASMGNDELPPPW